MEQLVWAVQAACSSLASRTSEFLPLLQSGAQAVAGNIVPPMVHSGINTGDNEDNVTTC